MFRGLKKAFSKGRTSEVQNIEAIPAQSDEPVPVRPRSKSAAATLLAGTPNEAAGSGRDSILSGLQETLPAASGNSPWGNNALSDSATPSRRATALSASPPVASPASQSQPASAVAAPGQPKPAAAATAWGSSATVVKDTPRSTPEKESAWSSPSKETPPNPRSRIGSFFRSGSANARSKAAEGPTSFEPLEQSSAAGSDARQQVEAADDGWLSVGSKKVGDKESAWSSSPGKETPPSHRPRLGSLFRSGSTNARNKAAEGPTSVEPIDQNSAGGNDVRQVEAANDVLPTAGSKKVQQHTSEAHPPADLLDDAGYSSAGRGGAQRTGSLMATPLAIENRRGPSVIG